MSNMGNPLLIKKIRSRMDESGGGIPFSEFMGLCLYDDPYGYYTKEGRKVGKEGDFYTSAYVGNAMGWALADFVAGSVESLADAEENVTLIEWGGGEGRLARTVLDTLSAERPELYRRLRFASAESSPFHRGLQQEALAAHAERVKTIASPDDPSIAKILGRGFTVLYANELLDAFPVHRVKKTGGEVREIFVTWSEEQSRFVEQLRPIADERVATALSRLPVRLREGQTAEVNVAALDWIAALGKEFDRGVAALIDYGDRSAELYGPHRMNGTLMCYRKHTANSDPYLWVGEQDITSHVDFQQCMHSAEVAGFAGMSLCTQKQFLVEHGVLGRLQQHAGLNPFSEEARSNRAIRQLLISDGMSELFKVFTMRKGV